MVFDKTGTLTEDGLQMHGVRPIKVIDHSKSNNKSTLP